MWRIPGKRRTAWRCRRTFIQVAKFTRTYLLVPTSKVISLMQLYVHVESIPFNTPSKASFSTAAATRSLSFNCRFTYLLQTFFSDQYLSFTLVCPWTNSNIHSESLRQSPFKSYSYTQPDQCGHTTMRNRRRYLH